MITDSCAAKFEFKTCQDSKTAQYTEFRALGAFAHYEHVLLYVNTLLLLMI